MLLSNTTTVLRSFRTRFGIVQIVYTSFTAIIFPAQIFLKNKYRTGCIKKEILQEYQLRCREAVTVRLSLSAFSANESYKLKMLKHGSNFPIFGWCTAETWLVLRRNVCGRWKSPSTREQTQSTIWCVWYGSLLVRRHGSFPHRYYWKGKSANTLFFNATMPFGILHCTQAIAVGSYKGDCMEWCKRFTTFGLFAFLGVIQATQIGCWFSERIKTPFEDFKGLNAYSWLRWWSRSKLVLSQRTIASGELNTSAWASSLSMH